MNVAANIADFCQAIPKVELHCHLLGSVRQSTFEWLAKRAHAEGRLNLSMDEVRSFYVRGEKPVGVLKALRALDAELLRLPSDLHRLTYEYLADAAAHQVRYAEFFWNPTGTARDSGIAYAPALGAICCAIADAQRDHGIIGRLIPAIDREASPSEAAEMLGWVLANRRDEVIGIGMDYREVDRPPQMFTETYLRAKRAGLKTTAHAGEFGMPWHNVDAAVNVLRCDRIDHGYTIVDDAFATSRLRDQCAERGIIFTVVPTNSYYLRTLSPERWAIDHPIRRMPALGLNIHPNTDDPTLHQVTPSKAWQMMVSDFGFSIADLRQFTTNGLQAAWIDDSTRRSWQKAHLAEFDAILMTN